MTKFSSLSFLLKKKKGDEEFTPKCHNATNKFETDTNVSHKVRLKNLGKNKQTENVVPEPELRPKVS